MVSVFHNWYEREINNHHFSYVLYLISLLSSLLIYYYALTLPDYDFENNDFRNLISPWFYFGLPVVFLLSCPHYVLLNFLCRRNHVCSFLICFTGCAILFFVFGNSYVTSQRYLKIVLGTKAADEFKILKLKVFDSFNDGDTYLICGKLQQQTFLNLIKEKNFKLTDSQDFNPHLKQLNSDLKFEKGDQTYENQKSMIFVKPDGTLYIYHRIRGLHYTGK